MATCLEHFLGTFSITFFQSQFGISILVKRTGFWDGLGRERKVVDQ
jgi:hypothetical protein